MEQARLLAQESRVRREGIIEQFAATRFDLAEILAGLAADAAVAAWEESLNTARADLEKLGQVNLAAIDELKESSERKEYLDRQFADVTSALTTLEEAMRKIDKETRTRFEDTFNRINAGLKDKFPKLFGGGHAYLELVGDDVLEAGVAVMARPPGKRNSSIHQLSGGEKALTAVALVFSIFDLNPAPFCLLDEVDAPLDEHNVGRFCDIVRQMSERVQFIFITHNKATMELASQLLGVTMHEPGCSRLVSVDVDEAVRMATGDEMHDRAAPHSPGRRRACSSPASRASNGGARVATAGRRAASRQEPAGRETSAPSARTSLPEINVVREARVVGRRQPAGHRAQQRVRIRHAPRARHRDIRRSGGGRRGSRSGAESPPRTQAAVHRPGRRSLGGARVRGTAGARSAAGARLAERNRAPHRHPARGAERRAALRGPRVAPGVRERGVLARSARHLSPAG